MNKTIATILGVVVSPRGLSLGILILRLAAGALMLTHGVSKLWNYGEMSANFPDMIGIGAKLSFTLIMLTEFVGSILLILGLFTRLSALALGIGMAVAAFIAHSPFTLSGSELPLLYMFIAVTLLVSGGGRYSADYYIGRYIAVLRNK